MLSHHETDNKDIIAIRYLEKEISESMSNLFITEYSDVSVLSVYSDLTKNLLAYKILNQAGLKEDSWPNTGFNKIIRVDFNPAFSLVPRKFVTSFAGEAGTSEGEIEIECKDLPGHIHYSKGLLKHQAVQRQDSVCVYATGKTYSIFIFHGKDCVFANSFKCDNELELLYFILNALDICGMIQEKTGLYLDYSMLADREINEMLKPYFMEVRALRLEHAGIDTLIPLLHEMLFANHLLSLCV